MADETQSVLNTPRAPLDLSAEGYSEKYFTDRRNRDAGAMRLKVDDNDPRGLTHKLKSQEHFWEGTEEQFRAQFDPAPSPAKKAAKDKDAAALEEKKQAEAKAEADKKAAAAAAKGAK